MLNRISITVNQLIASDLFLGYHIANWNPKMNFFLIGKYRNTNIFNINYTYSFSKKFGLFLSDLFTKKGYLWLVNENFSLFKMSPEFSKILTSFPEIYFFNEKWCKGMLSNYKHVSLVKPNKFPHSIFTPNMQNNHFVINESFLISIPSWSIADSLDNPLNVFFPLPGNSKSLKSVYFFYMFIAKTLLSARYIASSSFLFSSLKSKRSSVYTKPLVNIFLKNYFNSATKSFLVENVTFLFRILDFFRKGFSFVNRKKLGLKKKLCILRWKLPLLFNSIFFKKVLYLSLFDIIKRKKTILFKPSPVIKTALVSLILTL
jgi:ribosomal protein S2